MVKLKYVRLILLIFCGAMVHQISAQTRSSAEIYHELVKFKQTKRVLYVAAHPDDENTRLIAYLANELKAQVGYLSLTRGDGGQNLIGSELGIGLGQIRTQELLKAREIDGGRQFFTRAKDFGFSKNPNETLQNWDRQTILSDVVWVIRKFRPDIIITRFNTIPGVTHGHHTTSAILAEEAFDLAGRSDAFPEQLEYVAPWAPTRIFWNAYNFRGDFEPEEGKVYVEFPTGNFNPLLGKSYSQIAADSRTMHKSQGFGATAGIGEAVDHIQFIKGEPFSESPFDGVINRWTKLEQGVQIEQKIEEIIAHYDFENPSSIVPDLLNLRQKLNDESLDEVWFAEKLKFLDQLILQALGLDIEFNSQTETGFPGAEISAELLLNNPSPLEVSNLSVQLFGEIFTPENKSAVRNNKPLRLPIRSTIPTDTPFSQPYWLENYVDGPMYPVADQLKIGNAFNPAAVQSQLSFTIQGQTFQVNVPLKYKFNDQVKGEVKQPFSIVPEIDLSLSKFTVFNLAGKPGEVTVTVNFRDRIRDGELLFEGLKAENYRILAVSDDSFRKQRIYQVQFLKDKPGKNLIRAGYRTEDNQLFDQITNRISYDHIPNLTYFQPALILLIEADWEISGERIGYIAGAGDDVPAVLQSLGYSVTMIGPSDFDLEYLSQFKTIIVGIRAYNVNRDLASNQQVMMGYVRSGGHLIVQYNTSSPLLTNRLGPFPFSITRDRVAVESAQVTADFDHPILSGPNPIQASDFEGWVQERGLYFAGDFGGDYSTPFVMNDPQEDPKSGSLIYARYGEGTFIYTGLSFFRQLPAGVPGAIKLFINLIDQP
ncbi:PIG-L family deacetylase [Algoriphagus sp.]|uniref:PIG-L family deacetylase n=1 Tax=Algoriphagus sp. TaxID=1872435 RepID=UPI00262E165F|nr:PIG-L family deacetylase [Algoriphagus sp.]